MKVLFLGPLGTYSHQAAIQEFDRIDEIDYMPANSIPECFDKLETDESISYSVVPLENSTNGQVVFSYDLLRDRMLSSDVAKDASRALPSLEVVGEQYVAILHCLISAKVMQISDIGKYRIVNLHSHPQVWGQVTDYLDKLQKIFPDTKFIKTNTSSTSEAVHMINQKSRFQKESDCDTLCIAIAGETAASLNKCHILESKINDKKGNTTRFLVLKSTKNTSNRSTMNLNAQSGLIKNQQVSLLSFTINDDPGSLVNILTVLKDFSLNMCSINSRPFTTNELSSRNWQYVFFVEFYNNSEFTDWEALYTQINPKCLTWTLWGTFPRNKTYYS